MGIVDEIIVACKTVLDTLLTDYSQLPYQYNIVQNNEKDIDRGYSLAAGGASFVAGRSIGFTTIDHEFVLSLVNTYNNRDCDDDLQKVLNEQYALVQNVLKELQKSRLQLPTPSNRVLLISGLNIDEPEILAENNSVVLRANLNIQYNYQNN